MHMIQESNKRGILWLVLFSIVFAFFTSSGSLGAYWVILTMIMLFAFRLFLSKKHIIKVKGSIVYECILICLGFSQIFTGSKTLQILVALVMCVIWIYYFVLHVNPVEHPLDVSFMRILHTIFGSIQLMFHPLTDFWQAKSAGEKEDNKKKREIILGIVVSIPIVTIVLALLSGADMIFGEIVEKSFRWIRFEEFRFDEWIYHLFRFLFAFFATCGFVTYLVMNHGQEVQVLEKKRNVLIPTMYSGAIALIYLVFSIVQVKYLFLGNQLPEGYTYAEYARTGFFQLLFVCILNLTLLIYERRKYESNRILYVIQFIIGAMTFIMIFSSAYRMILYIKAYSLTFLRIFVLWCLAGLVILFAELLYMMIRKLEMRFHVLFLSFCLIFTLFSFSRPDVLIADINFQISGEESFSEIQRQHDFNLIYSLSSDAYQSIEELDRTLQNYEEYKEGQYSYDVIHEYLSTQKLKKVTSVKTFNVSYYKLYKK